jgi:hypothetical protein
MLESFERKTPPKPGPCGFGLAGPEQRRGRVGRVVFEPTTIPVSTAFLQFFHFFACPLTFHSAAARYAWQGSRSSSRLRLITCLRAMLSVHLAIAIGGQESIVKKRISTEAEILFSRRFQTM